MQNEEVFVEAELMFEIYCCWFHLYKKTVQTLQVTFKNFTIHYTAIRM